MGKISFYCKRFIEGAVGGLRRSVVSRNQVSTVEQGLIDQRFAKAVEQLGSDNVPLRIIGLNALKRIALQSPETDHVVAWHVISNFVLNSPYAEQQKRLHIQHSKAEMDTQLVSSTRIHCPDLIFAISILLNPTAKQQQIQHDQKYHFNLVAANFSYLQLVNIDFSNFDLRNSNFMHSDLKDANFACSELAGAQFTGADFNRAYLHDVDLRAADLSGADFSCAEMSEVNLCHAKLINTDLRDANLSGALLDQADLSGANLTEANLSHAEMYAANLSHAKLNEALLFDTKIDGSDVSGADLSSTISLTAQQLQSAYMDPDNPPQLPDEFKDMDFGIKQDQDD